MSVALGQSCQLKKGLFSCGASAAGICQYCARSFCAEHGVVLKDEQQICTRKVCSEKQTDVARHLAFKTTVRDRNTGGECGSPQCAGALAGQCSRCQGNFCAGHVRARDEMVLEHGVRVPRVATLCQHCWARRPLWTKT